MPAEQYPANAPTDRSWWCDSAQWATSFTACRRLLPCAAPSPICKSAGWWKSAGRSCCARVIRSDWLRARNGSRSPTGCMWPSFPVGAGRCFPMRRGVRSRSCRREVRARKYEVALDLQGAIRSALAARSTGAAIRIGSSQPREGPARMFYTHAIDVRGAHVVEHALSLASELAGQALEYVQPPFPVDPAIEAWADHQSEMFGGKPLAILNPGAGWGAKCWPAESFGAVARALADRGMAVLVNHGPGEEALAEAVRNSSGGVAVPLEVFGRRIDCADAARPPLHRRRYWPHAPCGGVARSGGCAVRSNATGAQRSFRHTQRGAAQSRERGQYDAHRPSR